MTSAAYWHCEMETQAANSRSCAEIGVLCLRRCAREGSNQPGTQEEVRFLSRSRLHPVTKGKPGTSLGDLPRSFGLNRLENILRAPSVILMTRWGCVKQLLFSQRPLGSSVKLLGEEPFSGPCTSWQPLAAAAGGKRCPKPPPEMAGGSDAG